MPIFQKYLQGNGDILLADIGEILIKCKCLNFVRTFQVDIANTNFISLMLFCYDCVVQRILNVQYDYKSRVNKLNCELF